MYLELFGYYIHTLQPSDKLSQYYANIWAYYLLYYFNLVFIPILVFTYNSDPIINEEPILEEKLLWKKIGQVKTFVSAKGACKYNISMFGGMGGLSQNADTADALEGEGGISQNADMLTL